MRSVDGYVWTLGWMPHSKVGPTCPHCQTIHGSTAAIAVGRFRNQGPIGYRSSLGGALRSSRDEAVRDFCMQVRGATSH